MARYKVYVSKPAEDDLRDVVRYIASQLSAPVSAMQMMNLLEEAMAGLAEMPRRYSLVADERLAQMGYRKLPVKNYIVFFSIDERRHLVDVERILYAKRDWLRFL